MLINYLKVYLTDLHTINYMSTTLVPLYTKTNNFFKNIILIYLSKINHLNLLLRIYKYMFIQI